MGHGTLLVGAGLSVTGAGTLFMMATTARWLVATQYQSFVTWWAVATFLGAGFFVFETYVSRLVVSEVADGRDPRRVLAVMAGRAWMTVVVISVAILASQAWIASTLFRGNVAAALLLIPFIVFAMLQSLQRGVATGQRMFLVNASQFATDGLGRMAFVTGAHLWAGSSVTHFALAACASAALSLVVAHRVFPHWLVPPVLRGEVSWRPLGYLVLSLTCILLINNGAIIWLSATHSVSAVTLGAFAGAITLSQIPTQLSSSITSPALSHLSYALERGDRHGYLRLRRLIMTVTSLAGAAFVLVFGWYGHDLLSLYLGASFRLGRGFMFALALASALMLLALSEQATLGAHQKWYAAALPWTLGSLAFGLSLLAPYSTIVRATLATDVSVSVAWSGMFVANARFSRDDRRRAASVP